MRVIWIGAVEGANLFQLAYFASETVNGLVVLLFKGCRVMLEALACWFSEVG